MVSLLAQHQRTEIKSVSHGAKYIVLSVPVNLPKYMSIQYREKYITSIV